MKVRVLILLIIPTLAVSQEQTDNKTLFVNKCDAFYDIGFSYTNRFDELISYGKLIALNGGHIDKAFTVDLKERTLVTFNKNFSMFPVFVDPGDTLEISCRDDGTYQFRKTGNNDESDPNFLVEIEKQFGFSFTRMSGLELTERTNFLYLMEEEIQLHDKKRKYLTEALASKRISQIFYDEILFEIEYKHALALLTPFTSGSRTIGLPAAYIQNLQKLHSLINNDNMLRSDAYRRFLWAFNIFLCHDSLNKADEDFTVLYSGVRKYFTGKSSDFLQLKLLKQFKRKGMPGLEIYSKEFLTACSDRAYIDHYKNFLSEFTPMIDKNETLMTPKGNQVTWSKILEDNQSKLIFIDFWASWCGPCLQEMPASKMLQDNLKGKDISFMYISIDSDTSKWISAAKKLPVDYATTKHFLTDRNSILSKAFNIPPIPRYLIIKNSGEVLALDADRPGHPTLVKTINDLLNE